MTNVMFLLLIVFVANFLDHATSCSCVKPDLEKSFCTKNSLVIRGIPMERFVTLPDDGFLTYYVQVVEVFKKPEGYDVSVGSTLELKTPKTDSLCGRDLQLLEDTLISGFGNQFGLCDFIVPYSSLTERQIDGITGQYECNQFTIVPF